MSLLSISLITINLVLMAVVFALVLALRKGAFSRPASVVQNIDVETVEAIGNELRGELKSIRRLIASLDVKGRELDEREARVRSMEARVESIVKKGDECVKDLTLLASDEADSYVKAIKMLKLGVPKDDVAKRLGLLSGEAELISSLDCIRN